MKIEKKKIKAASAEEIREQYVEAYKNVVNAENKMRKLLKEGGYIDE